MLEQSAQAREPRITFRVRASKGARIVAGSSKMLLKLRKVLKGAVAIGAQVFLGIHIPARISRVPLPLLRRFEKVLESSNCEAPMLRKAENEAVKIPQVSDAVSCFEMDKQS
jgi:hypothetical protein